MNPDYLDVKLWARVLIVGSAILMVVTSFFSPATHNMQALATVCAGGMIALAVSNKP